MLAPPENLVPFPFKIPFSCSSRENISNATEISEDWIRTEYFVLVDMFKTSNVEFPESYVCKSYVWVSYTKSLIFLLIIPHQHQPETWTTFYTSTYGVTSWQTLRKGMYGRHFMATWVKHKNRSLIFSPTALVTNLLEDKLLTENLIPWKSPF